jgi:hypothetical protein
MGILPNATETLYALTVSNFTELKLLLVGVPSYLKASDKSHGETTAEFTAVLMIK